MRLKSKEKVLQDFREVHGDRYDYSLVDYKNSTTKVTIICPEHGSFEQTPKNHSKGRGCHLCGYKSGRRWSQEDFINKAREIHGDKYDYSLTVYETYHKKVTITCDCGFVFEQEPASHLAGKGCMKCANRYSMTYQDFLDLAPKDVEYHQDTWVNIKTPMMMTCSEHGDFWLAPQLKLKGYSCEECGLGVRRKLTLEDFILKAREVHGDKYNYYSYVDYTTPVDISCELHGIFKQRPSSHLQGCGCPRCGRISSKPEDILADWFMSRGYEVKQQYKPSWLVPKSLDIYVPELNLAVEYNGYKFHHSTKNLSSFYDRTYKDPEYHKDKYLICKDNGIDLVHIFDTEPFDTWLAVFDNYIKNPDNFEITFENTERIKNRFVYYGKSEIKEE